ncbi:group III truncated hemoglobin [Pelobium manganitolerans]|uniref:group III truncated hemoglobin n=1 Tax=Pelobium manganitolerans TaxID=1842495 RepID=UPI003FA3994D
MKTDISNTDDVKLLVNQFYDKVNADKDLSFVFNDVAKVNWEAHLPIMYRFWNANLLGIPEYKGYVIDAHFSLNEKVKLTQDLFDRWLALFEETVDFYFEGSTAQLAKQRAQTIAQLMFFKLRQ